MAVDQRKRQRKLARRAKKQKTQRKAIARRDSQGIAGRLRRAASAPILHCLTITNIWDSGMGQVLVSRELPGGEVAFASFLVDTYCLGVKDVVMSVTPRAKYDREMYGRLASRYEFEHLSLASAWKLVEGAVEYAHDLGLPAHPDYRSGRHIFGDVDASESDREFVYGLNGQPSFVAGPHDSPERCRRIVSTLRETVGDDGFHCTMPLTPASLPGAWLIDGSDDDDADDVLLLE